jgi:hypothetical protein
MPYCSATYSSLTSERADGEKATSATAIDAAQRDFNFISAPSGSAAQRELPRRF